MRLTRKTCARLLVLACVGGALAGCGGGSNKPAPSADPSSTTVASTTKAQFIVRANAICRTMNARIAAIGDAGNDPIKIADESDQTAVITAAALRRLRALPAPPGDAAELNAIYAKVDKILTDAAKLSTALRAQDRLAAQLAANQLSADSDAANNASNAYGLTVCGS